MLRIDLIGNIGKDAERKALPSGVIIFVFSVGVNVGKNKESVWIDVTLNEALGSKLFPYLLKGKKVLVTGYPSVNAYMNKNKEPVGTMKVNANSIELLSSNTDTKEHEPATESNQLKSDIPF